MWSTRAEPERRQRFPLSISASRTVSDIVGEPMPSVIIPAHNETRVIARCLSALLSGAARDELEVIVVCNGCTDDTASVVQRFGQAIRLLETPVASKVHALNLGDAAATRFPRFFVDADVVIPLEVVREIAQRLGAATLAAAPRARFELQGSSWPVRAFYAIHERLPSAREGIGGSGVYALSEEGRRRFDRFPDLIADDGFVRLQFREHERMTLAECRSIVFAPRTLRELIRIKTRSHLGTAQLRRRYPAQWCNRGASNAAAVRALCAQPARWPMLLVYAFVKISARVRARRRLRACDLRWERDESSRAAPRAPVPTAGMPEMPAGSLADQVLA